MKLSACLSALALSAMVAATPLQYVKNDDIDTLILRGRPVNLVTEPGEAIVGERGAEPFFVNCAYQDPNPDVGTWFSLTDNLGWASAYVVHNIDPSGIPGPEPCP